VAIEVCEKLYHDTVLRKSTGEVGLARLPSGLELVRIGRPIFPEYADWRYGERFKRRKWIARGTTAAAVVGVVGFMWGLPAAMSALGVGAVSTQWMYHLWNAWREEARARRVIGSYYPSLDRPSEPLLGAHLKGLTIEADVPMAWRLELPKIKRELLQTKVDKKYRHNVLGITFGGELPNIQPVPHGDETRLLTTTIHQINRDGGTGSTVRTALEMYDKDKGDLFRRVGETVHERGKGHRMKVAMLPAPIRLALEIQLAEKRDTAWLDGELSTLTAAWKEAEEIAAIADRLTGPEWMDDELEAARKAREGTRPG
jgi:hypothetical protein